MSQNRIYVRPRMYPHTEIPHLWIFYDALQPRVFENYEVLNFLKLYNTSI